MSNGRFSRRCLLKGAALAAASAPYVITSTALGNAETPPASERVVLGHIGVGNRGRSLLRGFMDCQGAQCVAVSDAYKSRRDSCAEWIQGQAYADFRDLLARDDIDAVVVATPDHWHVPVAMAAATAGKDAYVEKPLGISAEQDLLCRNLFREKKRIFQYGTQQRSSPHCRFGCELVRSGRIGKIQRMEVIAPNGGAGGSTEEIPVPPDLDYEAWVGPAPMAPYTAGRCNPPGTYWIYDYSIGYLGGWGAHPLDIMVWGSLDDLTGPMTFEGTGVIPSEGLYDTVYDWNMKIQMAEVELVFTPGGDSTKFIGPDGWVRIWRGGIDAEPKSLLDSKIGPDEVHLVESPLQDQNFVDAVKSRQDPVSNIDDAVRSDLISHLCDIAVRTGRKITWCPKKEEILGDPEASKMLHRDMRPPWTL
ncbi:MAG: dehydrogenase [Planctomycetes bacterium RBG_16_64_12]|nr:MAG: dehydrogenase [Planctomycetes bacterium RBG_16_64_12]